LPDRESFIHDFQTVFLTNNRGMKQTFTPEQLIQFLYKETSLSESLEIAEELERNPLLRDEFEEMLEAFQELPKVAFRPSERTISAILHYSEQATLETLQ